MRIKNIFKITSATNRGGSNSRSELRSVTSRVYLTFLMAVVFFCFANFQNQMSAAEQEESVKVNATIIIASNNGTDMDLDNDHYRDQLIQLFSYKSYRQVTVIPAELKRRLPTSLSLPEGFELVLNYTEEKRSKIQINAIIFKAGQQYVDTVLSLQRPGTVFLGGPQVAEGSLIIVLETGF